jgi:hypothetical protein
MKHLAREGSANVFIGLYPVLDTFLFMYNLEVCGLIFDHNTIRDISLSSGKLNNEVIRKTYPRPI